MKRVLLGTTALVAAGFIAGEAQAGFDVTVNGNYYNAYGYVNEDDDDGESGHNRQNQAINSDYEVHFRIKQTLDNGIIVGGRVELEGSTHSDQIDERWIFFRGGFGEVRIGDEDDARKLKSYTAPDPAGFIFGVNSPYFTFQNLATGQVVSSNTTVANLENDSAKIIYFTPSFSGFQLVASYAPAGSQDATGFGTRSTQQPGRVANAISVGADWSGEFSGVTIGAGGGYSMGSAETSDDDPTIWQAGVNLGYAGFTVGGSVTVGDETGTTGFSGYSADQATVYDVGVTYKIDAVTVGLGWSHGTYQQTSDGQDDDLDFVNLGAGYQLGEGVLLAAFIGYFDYSDGGPTDNDNTGYQAGIGAGLDF